MARSSIGTNIAFVALALVYSAAAVFYLDHLADSAGIFEGYDEDGLAKFDNASTFLFFGGVFFVVLLTEIFRRIGRPVSGGILITAMGITLFSIVYVVWSKSGTIGVV